MKKLLSMMIALICIFTAANFAFAEGTAWHCDACGETRTTEWCPICGSQRPKAEASTWTCPACGKEIPAEYNFCPDDRAEKQTSNGAWPVRTLNGAGTALKEAQSSSTRRQAYYGPNQDYPGAGAYKPYKVTSAAAILREGDYVLVDMDYKTVGRRILYFKASLLTNSSVESVSLKAYPAVTTGDVQPYFGPGYFYDEVEKNTENPRTGVICTEKVTVGAGTAINVFFEADGWVFAEFGCSLGTIRAWLPVGMVR